MRLTEKEDIDEKVCEINSSTAREDLDDLAKELEEKTTQKLSSILEDEADEELITGVHAFVGLLCNVKEPTIDQIKHTF